MLDAAMGALGYLPTQYTSIPLPSRHNRATNAGYSRISYAVTLSVISGVSGHFTRSAGDGLGILSGAQRLAELLWDFLLSDASWPVIECDHVLI